MSTSLVVRGACPHDCPDTCATVTTVTDGRAVDIRGDAEHPVTQGFLCAKVNRYLERTYHPDRILTPLKRIGVKGEGRFAPVGWDEALEGIVADLRRTVESHGPQAVLPYSYSGTLGLLQGESMSMRFFHRLGASLLDRTICASAGSAAWSSVYGRREGPGPDEIGDARLILLWGTNTLTSNPHLWPAIRRARETGARVVCIDPLRTRTARASDEHVAPRPGTDAALALSMMHVLFTRGLADLDFLTRRTTGWEALRDRAVRDWPVQRAADICDLPAETIEALALDYGAQSRSVIRLNYGMQRHSGGGAAIRAVSLLPAVTGAWRHRGCGATLSTSGAFDADRAGLQRPDWIPHGTRTVNMSRLADALTSTDAGVGGPPVGALVVYNSNPAVIAPDSSRVRAGLRRPDLVTVVLEQFRTDTVAFADWVLPATTQLEHWDVHQAYGHHYLTLNTPAIAPQGEAVSNTEAFRRLARAWGFTDPEFADTDEDLLRTALGPAEDPRMPGVTLDALKERGWVRLAPAAHPPYAEGRLATASGLIQCVDESLVAWGLDPVPDYVPPREAGPTAVGTRYPLTLLSPPEHHFLNSSFANVDVLARAAGEQTVLVHPDDAQARGIVDGAQVRVINDRGVFDGRAMVSQDTRVGTVAAFGLRWTGNRPGVNDTTSTHLTDLGAGATFYDNAVDVVAVSSVSSVK